MTSSMSVELTPGQRCLLDLLQRKLLSTIQSYAKLSLERQEPSSQVCNSDELEAELHRLKEKIRRISARQKRFTLEIINGNGNNTIPKESFFEALGLVTKEALIKLNSKTNERRRRTTANPRFSHEAIQAKKALEPLKKRLEPRVSRDKKEASKRPAAQQRQQQQSNSNSDANIIEATSNAKNKNNSNNNNNGGRAGNQQASNSTRSSSRSKSKRNRNLMIQNERRELLAQFEKLQRQINTKVDRIKDKRESNKKLERQNELIRKRGLKIISAINMINPNMTLQKDSQMQISSASNATNNNNNHNESDQTTQPAEPLDIWIDMKCDESLDGLD